MTSQIIQELHQKEKTLKALRAKIQPRLLNAPEGSLRITQKKGVPFYYHRGKAHNTAPDYYGTYIKKSEAALIHKLAQKEYEENLLKAIEIQLSQIQRFLAKYNPDLLADVFTKLPQHKQALITPYILSDGEYAKSWQNTPFSSKNFAVNDPEIYTEQNERVRSKSEKILADKFFKYQIPYKYECPLTLKGYGVVYPDFTLLNKRTRKIFFWEHFGMMDNPVYSESAVKKIESYAKSGIYPGKSLLLTYETKNYPLNIKIADSLIGEFLT